MGNATGLFNMLRNIGGSIGIAMATTALIRRAALHQTDLGANLSPPAPSCSRKPPAMAMLSRPPDRPRPGPSWRLRAALRATDATGCAAGLRRCVSLDGGSGAFSAPAPSGCSANRKSTRRRRRERTEIRATRNGRAASMLLTGCVTLGGRAFRPWAGARGFRDFPLLPAAKENRNGSRRTLPG